MTNPYSHKCSECPPYQYNPELVELLVERAKRFMYLGNRSDKFALEAVIAEIEKQKKNHAA